MELSINLDEQIIPMYKPVLKDILNHDHVHYVFPGGRGSTKSTFVGGDAIPLLIMSYPDVHAVAFRKVGNTVQKSIFSQIVWGIYHLGLEELFKIPKTFASPIIYKQTGQQIICMGLDDPQKVKSIKLPFGYIGITWFEELDQYAGENELRNVTQSTMRGGDKFWDFRTFNPPISKNNWANEYVEDCEMYRQEDTLVVRNTYLDVPKDWLGDQFIEEAEFLKDINERAYIHEYLGEAIGTGGDVFPNVSDLDMEQLKQFTDANGNVIKEVPLYQTFDPIYYGMDVGFAMDPTAFVKCYFDTSHLDLYIFDEHESRHNRSADIYDQLYNQRKLITNEDMLICDSGGGGTFVIADFRAFGAFAREADKGPGSVDYGIKWLQGLRNIYIDKRRCPNAYREFVEYEYEQDKDGNFISAYPDENNHYIDACLTGDTKVLTVEGPIEISQLVGIEGKLYAYDIETHRRVVANYTHCRQTYESAKIYQVELQEGRIIRCTYEHKILTVSRGYVMAGELTEDDKVVVIGHQKGLEVISVTDTGKEEAVYDLEVPEYHNFILDNGAVVHNCRYALQKWANRKGN